MTMLVKGIDWLTVTTEQKGFRDIHWCNLTNEPFVIKYKPGTNDKMCSWCENWDDEQHPFICHIKKAEPQ